MSFGFDPINTNRGYIGEQSFRNSHSFGSNHPGGAQFSMADGSVRFFPEATEILVLRQLSSIASREVVREF